MPASNYYKPTNFPHGITSQGSAIGENSDITGTLTTMTDTAPVAGGSAAILFSSVAGLGIYFGSGPPTIAAAQGSLYLNTTASTNITRAYINTTGSTVWTAVNTVA